VIEMGGWCGVVWCGYMCANFMSHVTTSNVITTTIAANTTIANITTHSPLLLLSYTGAFVKLAEEMVYKHGITFISSAGNNGPNISTVGAPMASCIVSVGAFVTKSLMRTAYSIHETNVSTIPEVID
jgi:hypothetical protein